MTVINLPPLRFPVSDFEGTVETVSVQLTLQTHLHANRGKGIPTMLSHLCDVARQVIAPILSGEIPVSMDEFSERCSQAILQNGQLLSEGLSASSVQVTTQLHPTPQRRTWHAVGALPDAYIKNELKKFIALGSNVGDRIEALEIACRTLDQDEEIHVVETSPLYETEPMYVEDQDCFLNGVCEIVTNLGPLELLDRLQAIENGLGRHKTIDKGPRNIDLDILTYGQRTVSTERLTVPHALMLEREFVLRPLCDTSGGSWPHPSTHESAEAHLRRLPPSTTPMFPITALGAGLEPLRSLDPKRKTRVMSILNVTPDSFSDGGMNQPTDLNHLKETILANLAAGATIIDIGGQSSRPNADDVSAEEEISRVLPAIELIKSLPEAQGIAISIDTYRASVAEAAVKAGAHIVNDISAGLLDPDMLPTIARLGCTYIMMHMRGTPATMQNEENTSYPDGLILSVANELRGRLNAAREAGIRRWRIILDPGIGFAKTLEQNVELLKRFAELRNSEGLTTYPWLVGTSRKGFIGKVTGVKDAKDRVGGTAATVTAAVQGGAEIVRVHDVKEMVEVVKMADAMYRG
ncbi:related to dihydropteroate synthase/7,-6-hydroxymethylpterin-pyrophosphokinase/Dihydroneopterin aldolase [Ramularia collo-cygni]|uniref:Folic acid synthesis protein FOL1 n=1 Tax=Ramularia collo-cygni TaxID=112498 RepID=A0A2D3UUI4_9PEZI|nr:related to dihydropteroate synthase/7,-6-hydroxymethylpterin-pyrophosphokinase/Dihydroneopterin aldolase [Ramularia collo-cygni]CZT17745.1 related to dihydropteroate synthase/7,-6-hydroxymethylpterin-pyrophosphokinase/Dihydroneopterin aldolase [Ramularia collo-cygni]